MESVRLPHPDVWATKRQFSQNLEKGPAWAEHNPLAPCRLRVHLVHRRVGTPCLRDSRLAACMDRPTLEYRMSGFPTGLRVFFGLPESGVKGCDAMGAVGRIHCSTVCMWRSPWRGVWKGGWSPVCGIRWCILAV